MASSNHKKPQYRVQALDRALTILECFNFHDKEMNLSALTQRTGLNKTTVKRLAANLTARGYLQQDPNTKNYQLGLRLFELGGVVFSSFSLRKAAAEPMTHLQHVTGATILLGSIMEDQLVYIDKREGTGMIRIASDIGWRRPLHYGMLGMMLMAFLSPAEIERILKKQPLIAHTPFSITDEAVFVKRLETIRKQGHLIEWEEAVEGVAGIAAPIRNYARKVTAALGIALTLNRGNGKKDQAAMRCHVERVIKACNDISANLGYRKR